LIGLRCTTAGVAGVEGVENAADTLPPVANAGVDELLVVDAGSGMLVRDGGVRGAPNDIDRAGVRLRGAAEGDSGFASGTSERGIESFGTAGELRGENGGVLRRVAPDAGTAWAGMGAAGSATARRGAAGSFTSPRAIGGGQVGEGGTAPADLARTGFTPRGVDPALAPLAEGTAGKSSPQLTAAPTGMRPPHTEHRARIEMLVIFDGSRRKTDRHSGQETFIGSAGPVESGIRRGVAPE
jgi:hypothetical protein